MVQISKEKLEEFKMLYKKHFDKEVTDQEALEKGTKLVNFMRVVLRQSSQKYSKYRGKMIISPNDPKHFVVRLLI